ncbi:hypothetical protein MKX50_04010 [Paenibacillus sp. FSL W8-0186]|uniref:Uncharacterized protein n=1 Tax=Paenibacillus woosongensis TaxID=307580 RepID=A0ABQ4MYG1_9BACL|nr:hypothetical protein [Paenibacillus woosongensis]GIP60983.1 hypothetical protein J15TS10_47970 [Paenibacillus woosongensis]
MKQGLVRIVSVVLAAVFFAGLTYASRAEAGYFDDFFKGVKVLSELPNDINEIKENYQVTLDKLEEAQGTLEAYRQQNEELMASNRELAATVSALTEAQEVRDAKARKTRIMLITGAALLAGYFILLRVIRVVLRR